VHELILLMDNYGVEQGGVAGGVPEAKMTLTEKIVDVVTWTYRANNPFNGVQVLLTQSQTPVAQNLTSVVVLSCVACPELPPPPPCCSGDTTLGGEQAHVCCLRCRATTTASSTPAARPAVCRARRHPRPRLVVTAAAAAVTTTTRGFAAGPQAQGATHLRARGLIERIGRCSAEVAVRVDNVERVAWRFTLPHKRVRSELGCHSHRF
jgi:hypothetical protein